VEKPRPKQITFNIPPDIEARMKTGRPSWFMLEFDGADEGGFKYERPHKFWAHITRLEMSVVTGGEKPDLEVKVALETKTQGAWDMIFTSHNGGKLVCTNERLMEAMAPKEEEVVVEA